MKSALTSQQRELTNAYIDGASADRIREIQNKHRKQNRKIGIIITLLALLVLVSAILIMAL